MKEKIVGLWAVMSLAAVGGLLCAHAADTHDYSTYVQLKATLTIEAAQSENPPPATAWNPEGEMSADKAYLIPAGKTLTSKTSKDYSPATWPGQELAVAGTLGVSASGGRTGAAQMPPLALLPGGKLYPQSAYGTIISPSVDVRSTAESPAVIQYNYNGANDKAAYYALLSTAITGDETAVLRFWHSASCGDYDMQRAFRVTGGLANYKGTVIVDGIYTWLRDTGSTTFNLGGTMQLVNGGSLLIDTQNPTFGGLAISAGSTLRIENGKVLTVAGPVEIDEAAVIAVVKNFAYDTGTSGPARIPFLSVKGAANAAAVDRDSLLAALLRGTTLNGLASGVPEVILDETPRADGGVDFIVTHSPIVKQTSSCGSGRGPYGYGHYTNYLSNAVNNDTYAIQPDVDYFTSAHVYFASGYVFPGRSLTTAGLIGFYGGYQLTVNDLRVLPGAWVRFMSTNSSGTLFGTATLYGDWEYRWNGTGLFRVAADLKGAGDLCLALDIEKAIEKKTQYKARYELTGDNSDWKGRVLVGATNNSDPEKNQIGITNVTLTVSEAKHLGGARDAFTFDSVKVSQACTVAVTNDAAFTAANNGWCLKDGSSVSVAEAKTATVGAAVTFGGTVTKRGAGALLVGGTAKFYDAENDAAVETPQGEKLIVAEGAIGAVSAGAFAGLGEIAFAAGTSFVVDLSVPAGADLSATEITVPEGGIPVVFANLPEVECSRTVAILAAAADAEKFTLVPPRGYTVVRSVETVDGKAVLKATVARKGFTLILR